MKFNITNINVEPTVKTKNITSTQLRVILSALNYPVKQQKQFIKQAIWRLRNDKKLVRRIDGPRIVALKQSIPREKREKFDAAREAMREEKIQERVRKEAEKVRRATQR